MVQVVNFENEGTRGKTEEWGCPLYGQKGNETNLFLTEMLMNREVEGGAPDTHVAKDE